RVDEIAGNVAWIDRLDEQRDAVRRHEIGGEAQIGDIDRLALRTRAALGPDAGDRMDLPAPRQQRIAQRPLDGGDELALAAGERRDAALALGEFARRKVEEHQPQIMALE